MKIQSKNRHDKTSMQSANTTSADHATKQPNGFVEHFKAIIVVPLHEIVENIYKLLSHAPGFQSHALFILPVERSPSLRTDRSHHRDLPNKFNTLDARSWRRNTQLRQSGR